MSLMNESQATENEVVNEVDPNRFVRVFVDHAMWHGGREVWHTEQPANTGPDAIEVPVSELVSHRQQEDVQPALNHIAHRFQTSWQAPEDMDLVYCELHVSSAPILLSALVTNGFSGHIEEIV